MDITHIYGNFPHKILIDAHSQDETQENLNK